MPNFRLILTLMRIMVTLLFVANIIYMVQLYGSIKSRCLSDVEQCLCRADQIEMVDRIVSAGWADDGGVVTLEIGLQKSEVGETLDASELAELDYSQGYRRADRQILSYITDYLHSSYDDLVGPVDYRALEKALRRDLAFSDYNPDEVIVTAPDAPAPDGDLWTVTYSVDGEPVYNAYISPLTGNILREMEGVIVTSALIAVVLTFGFWYLLHVIRRLRTIEEMKDDFTNNMTHELKTPIAIAYAANDALLQFPDPQDEERTKKYLTAALDQLTKLAALVESILAMSMERRRNLEMNREKLNLREILASIIEQQKLRADKTCDITLDCPDDAVVEADPVHFSNVIANLLDNSIKYSGDTVSVTVRAENGFVSVTDNGIGIPEKALKEIFGKFYRVPQGNRSEVRGYGIGLYYVKSIVDKHGWSITVDSRLGKGSTFKIIFTQQ